MTATNEGMRQARTPMEPVPLSMQRIPIDDATSAVALALHTSLQTSGRTAQQRRFEYTYAARNVTVMVSSAMVGASVITLNDDLDVLYEPFDSALPRVIEAFPGSLLLDVAPSQMSKERDYYFFTPASPKEIRYGSSDFSDRKYALAIGRVAPLLTRVMTEVEATFEERRHRLDVVFQAPPQVIKQVADNRVPVQVYDERSPWRRFIDRASEAGFVPRPSSPRHDR